MNTPVSYCSLDQEPLLDGAVTIDVVNRDGETVNQFQTFSDCRSTRLSPRERQALRLGNLSVVPNLDGSKCYDV